MHYLENEVLVFLQVQVFLGAEARGFDGKGDRIRGIRLFAKFSFSGSVSWSLELFQLVH